MEGLEVSQNVSSDLMSVQIEDRIAGWKVNESIGDFYFSHLLQIRMINQLVDTSPMED